MVDLNSPVKHRAKLPNVEDFDGCNRNFSSISETVVMMLDEMKHHREHTHDYLTKASVEVNENITKLSSDINRILSSQATMFSIAIITVGAVIVSIKSLFDFAVNIAHLLF